MELGVNSLENIIAEREFPIKHFSEKEMKSLMLDCL